MLEEEADEEETTVVPNVLFVPSVANIIIILLLSFLLVYYSLHQMHVASVFVFGRSYMKDMTRRDDESDETLITRVFCSDL